MVKIKIDDKTYVEFGRHSFFNKNLINVRVINVFQSGCFGFQQKEYFTYGTWFWLNTLTGEVKGSTFEDFIYCNFSEGEIIRKAWLKLKNEKK